MHAARKLALISLLLSLPLMAADEFTLYELLPPDTHQFAITYYVTETKEGARLFFNPIRPGSIASKKRLTCRATCEDFPFDFIISQYPNPTLPPPPHTART